MLRDLQRFAFFLLFWQLPFPSLILFLLSNPLFLNLNLRFSFLVIYSSFLLILTNVISVSRLIFHALCRLRDSDFHFLVLWLITSEIHIFSQDSVCFLTILPFIFLILLFQCLILLFLCLVSLFLRLNLWFLCLV